MISVLEKGKSSLLNTTTNSSSLFLFKTTANKCSLPSSTDFSSLTLSHACVDYRRNEILGLKDRIANAVDRGIQLLDAESNTTYREDDGLDYPCIEFMPLNLCTSKTLVSLKLSFSGLQDPGFVSMPCLRFMHLREVRWSGTMTLEKLVSGCPVLEELTYIMYPDDDELVVRRVRSQSLKRFYVPRAQGSCCRPIVAQTLETDAPGLEYMSLKEDHFERMVVKNLTSLFAIDLNIKFAVKYGHMFDPEDLSKIKEISDFLSGISRVRHMIISPQTVKALDRYSKVGAIPKFNNLSRLEVAYPATLLQLMPAFLESFPNLKHLILVKPFGDFGTRTKLVLWILIIEDIFVALLVLIGVVLSQSRSTNVVAFLISLNLIFLDVFRDIASC